MEKKELIESFFEEYKKKGLFLDFSKLEIYNFSKLEKAKDLSFISLNSLNKLKEYFNLFRKNNIKIEEIFKHDFWLNENKFYLCHIEKSGEKIKLILYLGIIIQYLKIETDIVLDKDELLEKKKEKIKNMDILEVLDFIEQCLYKRIEDINEYINFLNSEVEE